MYSSGGPQSRSFSAAASAARLRTNQQQMRYFAAGICGMMAIFILSHWLRLVFSRKGSSKNPIRSMSRIVRSLLVRKVPGFTSSGHVLVVAAYVAINLAVTFTNVQMSLSTIAKRCGWMLTANLCVVVFLALRNTPLAILSAYSYERLNGLHQIAGYTTFGYLVLHASMYTHYFVSAGRAHALLSDTGVAGIVGGFALLGAVLAAAVVRRVWYEAFYVAHVACFATVLVAAGLHHPDLSKDGILAAIAAAAGAWGADRLVRGARVLWRAGRTSGGNHAVVEPLPDGGTRVTLARWPAGAVAGKHCFLWIPRVRLLETHPFTIASTGPVEFVVHAHDGFTRDLHRYAAANPGARLLASFDGPYGTFPDPMAFDRVVLIAGGSGATFTFGLAVNMLERMGPEPTKDIVFIWAVKKHDNLSWFADHLQTLKTHAHSSKINVSLYVTRAALSDDPSRVGSSDTLDFRHSSTAIVQVSGGGNEKALERGPSSPTSSTANEEEAAVAISVDEKSSAGEHRRGDYYHHHQGGDPEKALAAPRERHHECNPRGSSSSSASTSSGHGHEVKAGRPDAATLVREAVSSAPAGGRVLVAACGPDGLMRVVRDTTADLIRGDGPGVELHCEQFGW